MIRILRVLPLGLLLLNSLILASPAPPAQAVPENVIWVDTEIVESDGSCDDSDCSLRDAIDVAIPGQMISF